MTLSYSETVTAGLFNKQGMEEWVDYLSKLSRFQSRQKELIVTLSRKRKGASLSELARMVLPILKQEMLCEGLPDYVVNGY